MVAYSFAKQFVPAVASGEKRQTVRGPRKRHARPGEPIQLYTAMRTKHCRKILTPDPVCFSVTPILMDVCKHDDQLISSIALNGIALSDAEIESFAVADGFGSDLAEGFARRRMGEFWLNTHLKPETIGFEFEGVVIRWGADA